MLACVILASQLAVTQERDTFADWPLAGFYEGVRMYMFPSGKRLVVWSAGKGYVVELLAKPYVLELGPMPEPDYERSRIAIDQKESELRYYPGDEPARPVAFRTNDWTKVETDWSPMDLDYDPGSAGNIIAATDDERFFVAVGFAEDGSDPWYLSVKKFGRKVGKKIRWDLPPKGEGMSGSEYTRHLGLYSLEPMHLLVSMTIDTGASIFQVARYDLKTRQLNPVQEDIQVGREPGDDQFGPYFSRAAQLERSVLLLGSIHFVRNIPGDPGRNHRLMAEVTADGFKAWAIDIDTHDFVSSRDGRTRAFLNYNKGDVLTIFRSGKELFRARITATKN